MWNVRRAGVPSGSVPADLNRALRQSDIGCPAGEIRGESACRCKIEQTTIEGRTNPESIEAFCAGDYKACPTWRTEWERVHDENKKALSYIEEGRAAGAAAKARKEANRADRVERAKELLTANTEEAIRFRRRCGIPDRAGEHVAESIVA